MTRRIRELAQLSFLELREQEEELKEHISKLRTQLNAACDDLDDVQYLINAFPHE